MKDTNIVVTFAFPNGGSVSKTINVGWRPQEVQDDIDTRSASFEDVRTSLASTIAEAVDVELIKEVLHEYTVQCEENHR